MGRGRRRETGSAPQPSMREVQPEINVLVSPDEKRLVWVPPANAPGWVAKGPAGGDDD